MATTFLTKEEIKLKAPAIFANNPASWTSEKYSFMKTEKVIDILDKQGWGVSNVDQRTPIKKYAERSTIKQHLVRFRRYNDMKDVKSVGDEVPEIIVVNSHDGSKPFSFHIGIFRFVCSNGLVVATENFGKQSFIHKSFDEEYVIDVVNKSVKKFDIVFPLINEMKKIELSENEKIAFAKKASKIRWPQKEIQISADDLLIKRRNEDMINNLWTVFNVVQENMMKGQDVHYRYSKNEEFRVRKIKEIKDINKQIEWNKQLWELAQGYVTVK